ncbi:6-carboxyhexanoate--CoA ligase [Bacillus norwichensis]|nr:6-carboxyhexanoate--CoA ligase [Bacillus norwichensis]
MTNKSQTYYSVRMRAAKGGAHEQGGKHISGGEQISTFEGITHAVNFLLEKGLTHSKGSPDFMQIQFECIHDSVRLLKPLDVQSHQIESVEKGQALARQLLRQAGVPKSSIETLDQLLPSYSRQGGAVLFDIHSDRPIDERGIRVSRMDWQPDNYEQWAAYHGVPRNLRMKEALVLATKVTSHPAAVAELCWSDDPDYITGYVASKRLGYQRINKLKKFGDEQGCRIFFVNGREDIESYIHYLKKQPIFIRWEEAE